MVDSLRLIHPTQLNSQLMSGGYFQYQVPQLKTIPIPPIFFTIVEKELEKALEKTIKMYSNLKYGDILRWTEQELTRKRNDTIHDLIAYLADQILEMNKRKNEETKGFMKYCEREISAEIDNLANKTDLTGYHEHDFNQLLDVLKKNRNKISIDPSDRKIQELLENQSTKSMSILEPFKARIFKIDELIYEIVYRLYGLTEEELRQFEEKKA